MKYDINKFAPVGDKSREAKRHNMILEFMEMYDYDYAKIMDFCEDKCVAQDVLERAVYQALEYVDDEDLEEVVGKDDEDVCYEEPQKYGWDGMWQLGFRMSDFI